MGSSKEAVQQRHRSLGSIMQGRQDLDLMIIAKEIEELIIQNAVLKPFNVLEWLKKEDSASVMKSFRWKLLLSLPEAEDESSGRPFLEMIKRKFR